MSTPDPFSGCLRQVRLDFHNSPHLTDLLAEFDPRDLARRFKSAHVNSVVVFAKCVHGMGYYPSKIVTPHPALGYGRRAPSSHGPPTAVSNGPSFRDVYCYPQRAKTSLA